MKVIVGSAGQVGKSIVDRLIANGEKVKALIRDPAKGSLFKRSEGLSVEIADAFDLPSLKNAFRDATSVFLITPETGNSNDVIADTGRILENYREAIQNSPIKKLVGLSSLGAQFEKHTGNLRMSYMLEHGFEELDISKDFIRASYFYSNWINYIPLVREQKILPSFFPLDLKLPMLSPLEVAEFIAGKISENGTNSETYEVEGPEWYSTVDIARQFSEVLGFDVRPQQISKENWWKTIKEFGFSDNATMNFIEMTQAVIDGKAKPGGNGATNIKLRTTFQEFLIDKLREEQPQ